MNLRQKSIGIMGIALTGLFIVLYILLRTNIMNSFIAIEKQDVEHSVKQTKNMMMKDVMTINNFVSDWAEWDDTYDFLEDNSRKYVEDNLTNATFLQQRFSNVTYFDMNGEIKYLKGFNLAKREEEAVSEGFKQYFSPGSMALARILALQPETSLTGLICLPEGPMLIAARPILHTNRQGPANGVMLAGRYLDAIEIATLSAAAELKLEFTDIYNADTLAQLSDIKQVLVATEEVVVQAEDQQLIHGYGLIKDINENPALILKVDVPRKIYSEGLHSIKYFLWALLGASLVFIILVIFLLEKLVLSRLAKLDKTVNAIRDIGDMSTRLTLPGKDELSSLANSINHMLHALETTQADLRLSEAKNKAVISAIPDSMIIMDRDGVIADVKERKDLKISLATRGQIGKNISHIASEQFAVIMMKNVLMALAENKVQMFEHQIIDGGEQFCQEYRIATVDENQVLVMIKDISRRRKMEERLETAYRSTEQKNMEISLLLQNLEQSMAVVTILLNNTGQGILTFGSDYIIAPEYSTECKNIFGEDIAEKHFVTLALFQPDEQELFRGVISDVLQMTDWSRQRVFLSLLSDRLIVREQILAVQYKVIHESTRATDQRIMVILTDITEQVALQAQIDEERELQNIIVKVIEQHDKFIEFAKDFRWFLGNMCGGISNFPQIESVEKAEFYRKIHTFKGLFAQFGFEQLASLLHEIEDDVAAAEDIIQLRHSIKDTKMLAVEQQFDSELARLLHVFGERFFEVENRIYIDVERLVRLENALLSILSGTQAQAIFDELKRWRYKKISDLLLHYKSYIVELGQRMEKQVSPLAVHGATVLVDNAYYQEFVRSLVHVFRNMVDHGIESPEERILFGKEEYGQISCEIIFAGKDLCIEISDDGRGVDVEVIRQTAIERGILSLEELAKMDEQAIMDLIFSAGFSTKGSISDVSGRGVGLDAVRSVVEKMGGSVTVSSQAGVGTTFSFCLGTQYMIEENETKDV